jgi:hypothetical protein
MLKYPKMLKEFENLCLTLNYAEFHLQHFYALNLNLLSPLPKKYSFNVFFIWRQ